MARSSVDPKQSEWQDPSAIVFSDHRLRNYSLGTSQCKAYFRAESEMRKMAMKNHFIVLGCFLLLAMLGFALDVGITAMLLSHS